MTKFKILLLIVFLSSLTKQSQAQLQANFSADTTRGCGAISSIQFTDLSTGNPSSWLWDFGNGNTSTLQNPSASYASPGNYTVSLQVSNGTASNQVSKTSYITVFKKPIARISVGNFGGCPPLPVNFNSTSTPGDAAISTYVWDFGDGSQPANTANPTHIYQTGGSYPVSLQVTDLNNCSDNTIFNSVIVNPAPVALFSSSNSRFACSVPYTVNFVNNSSGSNLSYLWDFGDGTTSTLLNPSHSYANLGNYTVKLTASDPNCSDTVEIQNFVSIQNVVAQFSIPQDTLCFGTPFQPINTSQGGRLYSWNFGDGKSSTQENPSHQYPDSGWYRIRLIVSNGPACIEDYVDSVYVQRVIADFSSSVNYVCNKGDSILLTASGINIDSILWINQSGKSYLKSRNNPVKLIQNFEGYFSDSLIAYSLAGCSTIVAKDSNRFAEFVELELISSPPKGCEPLKVKYLYKASGPDTINQWQWDFGNGDSSILQFPDTVTFDTAGTYNVTLGVVTNQGCIGGGTGKIFVGTKQIPNFSLPFDSICPGDSIRITDLSQDTSIIQSIEYNVFTNSSNEIPLKPFDSLYFSNFRDTGYYSVEVKIIDRGCEVIKTVDSAFYVSGPIIKIGFIPDCVNRLSVPFLGNVLGANKFYWDFGDGSPLDSVNLNPVHNYSTAQKYTITFKAYNDISNCPMAIDSLTLDLNAPAPVSIISDKNDICINSDSRSTYQPLGFYNKSIWIIGTDTLSDSAFFIHESTAKGLKVIELFATDILGCPHTAKDTIRIYEPKANFTSDVQTGCLPLTVQFQDSSISDTSLTSWRWNLGNGQSSVLQNPSSGYSLAGNYPVSLYIENVFGCSDSILKADYIQTRDITVAFIENSVNICQGDSIYFRNLSTGNQISAVWNFGDNSPLDTNFDATHTFDSAGIFSIQLKITDASSCSKVLVKSMHISVQAKPDVAFSSDTSIANCYPLAVNFIDQSSSNVISWRWDFGDNSSSVFQNPFHNYTLPGKFDVSLEVETANGCKNTIQKPNYIQTEGPLATFSISEDTICVNQSVQFNLTSSNQVYSYTWDFGDGNSATGSPINHTYLKTGRIYPSLILSDSSGFCIVPIKDSLFVQPVKAIFSSSDSLGCGIPFEVKFKNLSIGASQFSWTIANSPYTISDPSVNFTSHGKYLAQLRIQSDIGCLDTAEQYIQISPKPIPTVSPDSGICPGDSIILSAGGGNSYRWIPNQFISSDTGSQIIAFPDTSIKYRVLVYNEAGCVDSASTLIKVPQAPSNYSLSDTSLIIGETLLTNIFVGDLFNYVWTPPKGLSCSNCPNPSIQPLETTLYQVHIFDDFGCFSIYDSLLIEIKNAFSVDVPKAFSPNNDRVNDLIYVRGWGIKKLIAFKIYNRFGELVFESNDLKKGWDGTYKSVEQPNETYVYTVEVLGYDDKILRKKGNITLLR